MCVLVRLSVYVCKRKRESVWSFYSFETVPLANTEWSRLIWVIAWSDRSSRSAGLMALWLLYFTLSRNLLCDLVVELIIQTGLHGALKQKNLKE